MPALAPDAAVEPVRIVYHASASCPGESEFVREVTARTNRVRAAGPVEPARTFALDVESGGGSHRARLRITATDGSVTERELAGADCAEVVSAMALVVALDIDPSASTSQVAPADGNGTLSASAVSATPAPPPAVSVAVPVGAAAAPPPTIPFEPRPEGAFRWAFGASAQGLAGLLPEPAFGGGVFVDLARPRAPFSPSFRGEFVIVTTEATLQDSIGVAATWYYARLQACPLRPFADRVQFDACAFVDAGAFQTSGKGLNHGASNIEGWFGAGLLGRFVWSPANHLELEAGGGVMIPLRGYAFQYDPGNGDVVEISEISSVGAAFFAAAGYRL